jgi:hypothetical protein
MCVMTVTFIFFFFLVLPAHIFIPYFLFFEEEKKSINVGVEGKVNVWDTFMPCNDIKEMLKLYILFVCWLLIHSFSSHSTTQSHLIT